MVYSFQQRKSPFFQNKWFFSRLQLSSSSATETAIAICEQKAFFSNRWTSHCHCNSKFNCTKEKDVQNTWSNTHIPNDPFNFNISPFVSPNRITIRFVCDRARCSCWLLFSSLAFFLLFHLGVGPRFQIICCFWCRNDYERSIQSECKIVIRWLCVGVSVCEIQCNRFRMWDSAIDSPTMNGNSLIQLPHKHFE